MYYFQRVNLNQVEVLNQTPMLSKEMIKEINAHISNCSIYQNMFIRFEKIPAPVIVDIIEARFLSQIHADVNACI